eukprot:scaffold95328_cov18-Tisochrysis_lutea.AAC.2
MASRANSAHSVARCCSLPHASPKSTKAYLLDKLCTHAQTLLQQEQQRLDPRARSSRHDSSNVNGSSDGEPVGFEVNAGLGFKEWQAADYAQLLWGLGSLGHVPPGRLLQLACRCVQVVLGDVLVCSGVQWRGGDSPANALAASKCGREKGGGGSVDGSGCSQAEHVVPKVVHGCKGCGGAAVVCRHAQRLLEPSCPPCFETKDINAHSQPHFQLSRMYMSGLAHVCTLCAVPATYG